MARESAEITQGVSDVLDDQRIRVRIKEFDPQPGRCGDP